MYLTQKKNLTNLTAFINENFKKKTDTEITVSDVQGYVRRKCLPSYMGNVEIIECNDIESVKLYSLKKIDK